MRWLLIAAVITALSLVGIARAEKMIIFPHGITGGGGGGGQQNALIIGIP